MKRDLYALSTGQREAEIFNQRATLDDLKAALAEYGYIAVKTDRITRIMHLVEELHVTSRDAECELGMLIQAAEEAADHE